TVCEPNFWYRRKCWPARNRLTSKSVHNENASTVLSIIIFYSLLQHKLLKIIVYDNILFVGFRIIKKLHLNTVYDSLVWLKRQSHKIQFIIIISFCKQSFSLLQHCQGSRRPYLNEMPLQIDILLKRKSIT